MRLGKQRTETGRAKTGSPIRRYGDLVAQQAAHAIHATPGSVMPIVDPRLAPCLNRCERRAFVCERYAANEWNLRAIARVDRDRWLSGRVVSATYLGLSVEADEIAGIHGLAHTSTLEPRDLATIAARIGRSVLAPAVS